MKSGSYDNATPPSARAAATGDDGHATADGSTTNPGAAGVEDGRKLVRSVLSLCHFLRKQRGVAPDRVCLGHSLLVCCRYSSHGTLGLCLQQSGVQYSYLLRVARERDHKIRDLVCWFRLPHTPALCASYQAMSGVSHPTLTSRDHMQCPIRDSMQNVPKFRP